MPVRASCRASADISGRAVRIGLELHSAGCAVSVCLVVVGVRHAGPLRRIEERVVILEASGSGVLVDK